MRWMLISLLILSVGCTTTSPTWTADRKALATRANTEGRAAWVRAQQHATALCDADCQFAREYADWEARTLVKPATMPLPLPMNCLSMPIGIVSSFSCY